jgi:N-acetylmuramoyl-L-alanine amidase
MRLRISVDHTRALAETIDSALAPHVAQLGRGVLAAPFVVLMAATMPAALVEVGFLSHPEECRRLGMPRYQEQLARALAEGITLAALQPLRAITAQRQ